MEFTRKTWNSNHKILRELLKKESTFKEAINMFLNQHAMVHASEVSGIECATFEDDLWEGMNEIVFRNGQNKKGRTVAYGMWHSARIEDITINLLVADDNQIIDKDNWMNRINSPIYDTGNVLDTDAILKFSQAINMNELRDYRKAVGKKTRKVVSSLTYSDLKTKALETGLGETIRLGAVANDEKASWLIDFWRKKTVSGIMLFTATRHNLVHINESMEAKKRGLKLSKNYN